MFECKPFNLENNREIINKTERSSWTVYPGPVTNTLKIKCTETNEKLEIYKSDGKINKIVYKRNPIDITELRGRIYFVRINDCNVQSFLKK